VLLRPNVTKLVLATALGLALASATLAVGKDKAEYVSGPFDAISAGTEGAISAASDRLVFVAEGASGLAEIPWARILDVEYAQKRTGLFETRHHFVSIDFRDERGVERRLRLELGKDIVLELLDACEQGTGRRVVYGDDDAASYRRENAPFKSS
jgi:hypothetical protein